MKTVADVLVAELTLQSFRSNIRNSVYGLWSGRIGYDQAYEYMLLAIERDYEIAWTEGAKICGIEPDDRTDEESTELNRFVVEHSQYIGRFLDYVDENSKENEGLRSRVYVRAELWVNRYNEVRNRAMTMACGNKKLIWNLGMTRDHCSSCLKMAGKVKRASQWDAANIRPQSPNLECKGYGCLCGLSPTDAPMSRGPLPRLP